MSRTIEAILEDPFGEYELTDRQREVLRLSAEGYEVKAIAATLGYSVRTIDYDRAAGFEIVGVKSAGELTRMIFDQLRQAVKEGER